MRVAANAPTYCSSCHGQYPERKYVDFDAYWDGPTLDGEGFVKVAIDDLILCDECLGAGAKLIGYVHNKEMVKENFELGRAVESKNEELTIARKMISDLEHTLNLALDGEIRRGSGRPTVRIPEPVGEVI